MCSVLIFLKSNLVKSVHISCILGEILDLGLGFLIEGKIVKSEAVELMVKIFLLWSSLTLLLVLDDCLLNFEKSCRIYQFSFFGKKNLSLG